MNKIEKAVDVVFLIVFGKRTLDFGDASCHQSDARRKAHPRSDGATKEKFVVTLQVAKNEPQTKLLFECAPRDH